MKTISEVPSCQNCRHFVTSPYYRDTCTSPNIAASANELDGFSVVSGKSSPLYERSCKGSCGLSGKNFQKGRWWRFGY